MDAKAHMRRRLLARRTALSESEIHVKSAAIATHLCAIPAFVASHTIMVYLAQAQEVQTGPIIATARRQGKRLVVPVVVGSRLMAAELSSDPALLQEGAYGIREPRWPLSVVPHEEIHCVVVPGVAFDRQGGRLGFGRGYYDRFLGHLPATACHWGLAFCLQLVPSVPRLPHDICVHGIVTEQGVIPCATHSARRPD
ncbi:putative protein YqgN [Candidatus Entotheonellaceae bacterium PAL068K]